MFPYKYNLSELTESYEQLAQYFLCQGLQFKGQLHSKNKLSSSERAWKVQKYEHSLTSMRQMVLEISQPKVRNLSKMEVAILKVFSLIFT